MHYYFLNGNLLPKKLTEDKMALFRITNYNTGASELQFLQPITGIELVRIVVKPGDNQQPVSWQNVTFLYIQTSYWDQGGCPQNYAALFTTSAKGREYAGSTSHYYDIRDNQPEITPGSLQNSQIWLAHHSSYLGEWISNLILFLQGNDILDAFQNLHSTAEVDNVMRLTGLSLTNPNDMQVDPSDPNPTQN